MSYSVKVYRRELAGASPEIFEQPERIPVFTTTERAQLAAFVERRGYEATASAGTTTRYRNAFFEDIELALTDRALYLSSSLSGESAYTILELGAEIALFGAFAVYNPQEGRWETPTEGESPPLAKSPVQRAEETLGQARALQTRSNENNQSALIATGIWIVPGALVGFFALGGWGIVLGAVVGFVGRVVQVKLARQRG